MDIVIDSLVWRDLGGFSSRYSLELLRSRHWTGEVETPEGIAFRIRINRLRISSRNDKLKEHPGSRTPALVSVPG